jgi:hypothetical protein
MATSGNGRARGARAVNKLKTMSRDERMGRRTKAAQAKATAAKKKAQPTLKEEYRKDAAAAKSGNSTRNMSRDAVMGRRAKAAQAGNTKPTKPVRPKANAPMKKETVAAKKKPVNIGNVSKPKRGERAAKSAAKTQAKAPELKKNVVRDGYGKPIKTSSGGYLRTNDFSKMSQDEIDKLYNM